MKLLLLLVVASLALLAVIDAALLDDAEFQPPAASLFGVADGGMRRIKASLPYRLNARLLATASPPAPKTSPPPPKTSPPPPKTTPPPPKTTPPPPKTSPPPPKTSPPPPPRPKSTRDTARWDKYYMNNWTPTNPPGGLVISQDEYHVDMKITSRSQIFGHFLTQKRYLYGNFSIYMKLIPGESAGCIMAYYFSSPENHAKDANGNDMDRHDEMDFEFLGNSTGQPITLQTNLYLEGKGNREQRHSLPFNPSAGFHKYSLLWNQHLVIWFIDDSVIRVHYNKVGVPFPKFRPMAVQASLWNGSDWATQGGKIKLDITKQPFILQYEGFGGVNGCAVCPTNQFSDPSPNCPMSRNAAYVAKCSSGHSFNKQMTLSTTQINQLKAHRKKYIIYNYCYDAARFGGVSKIPPECKNNEPK